MFWGSKKTSQGDVSFMQPKHMLYMLSCLADFALFVFFLS